MQEKRGNGDRSDDRQRELIDAALREADSIQQRAQATAAAPALDSALVELASDSVTGYKIVRQIHRGGQGVVYLALQQSTGREVAMKVMKEGPFAGTADRARFDREVQVLGQLNHPNIVTIHDSGSAAGHHFFVMDYVPGQPLDVYMAGAQRSIDETLRLFGKICDAVNAAHLRGVIHRDLKPGNIRVDTAGEPRVLDFGLAKVATPLSPPLEGGDGGGVAAMTLTGQFVGSLPWASPEQAEGAPSKIDLRTDVYSLGVILYQMLTGKFPYDVTGNVRDALDNIMTAEPVRPSVAAAGRSARAEARGSSTRLAFVASWLRRSVASPINDEVETIVLKCLSKERERRYQTAGELARDIGHYLAGEPIEAKRDSTWYVLSKQLRRYKVPAGIAAAFVLVVTIGFGASLHYWRQAERDRLEAQRQTTIAKMVNDFLHHDLLAAVAPEERGHEVTVREVLDAASQKVGGAFVDDPIVEASIRRTLGNAYQRLGEYAVAEPHLSQALRLSRGELGDDDPLTLDAKLSLSWLLHLQGKLSEAEPLYRETLEARRRLRGDEHAATLRVANHLAALYKDQQRFDEAEALFLRTLRAMRRVYGEENRSTLGAMNNLAMLYGDQGRHDEAEALFLRTIELMRRTLGEEAPFTLNCIGNLANLYWNLGRYDEAEPLYVRSLELRRRVFGAEHPHTLDGMHNLAVLYDTLGRHDEAERLYLQTLDIMRRVLDAAHPSTLTATQNLAELYETQQRHQEAETLLLAYYETVTTPLGENSAPSRAVIASLVEIYETCGRPEEAAKWRAKLPSDQLADVLAKRGLRLVQQGEHVEAEQSLRESRKIQQESLPEGDWRVFDTMSLLGESLTGQGKFNEAETFLIDGFQRMNPPPAKADHKHQALERIIKLYEAWNVAEPGTGKAEQAAEYRRLLGQSPPPTTSATTQP